MDITRFEVGDFVRIVKEPYVKCPFGWVREMNEFCGREARITNVFRRATPAADEYYIDIDRQKYVWSFKCFEHTDPDINESDKDLTALFA